MKPRLSICIATYNRALYIGSTLESIIPQLTEDVEVIIVDGSSTDNTRSIVESYVDKCKQIRYFRLPIKGGVDQDYCKAMEFSEGEMCWLFTDDDLLKPNAINTVLNEIKKGYCLIVVNAHLMNIDFSKEISNRLIDIQRNEIYSEFELDSFFDRVITYMSFIGCVVIKRDLWMQRNTERYFGTEFIHVGVVFQSPLPSSALVIAEPNIKIRYGNAQWSKRAFEIGMFKWTALLDSFEHLSLKVKQKYNMSNPWRRLSAFIIFRAKGEYTFTEYSKWVTLKKPSLWWKILVFFIAVTPSACLNLVILAYLKIMKKEKNILIFDLENNKHSIYKILKLK